MESYTATTVIDAPPERVFEYVRVPENQPTWAINFVFGTRPLSDGRYVMDTPLGEITYRVRANAAAGTVDFVLDGPDGASTLGTRALGHAGKTVFTFTIHRAPRMAEEDWAAGRRGLDEELAQLRRLLEAAAAG